MGRYAQLVCGPAGAGKSTYCETVRAHCEASNERRELRVINLDPAAEELAYEAAIDIRELVSLEDVMEELGLGPNGGLLYCFDYLEEHLEDWLQRELTDFAEECYFLIDMPGQIELFTQGSVLRKLTRALAVWDVRCVAVYVLDSHFASDVAKFVSGAMACLSTMTMLELPHVNVLSKVDKIAEEDREKLEGFLNPDARLLMADLAEGTPERLGALNNAVANLLDDYAMVSFLPLDVRDEDTVSVVLMHCDEAVQFAENQEPRENFPEDGPDDL